MTRVTRRLQRLVESRMFHGIVIALIIGNAAIMGLETSPQVMARWGGTLLGLNTLAQFAFVIEIILCIAAEWPRPLAFFRRGWNCFDFLVVAASLLPVAGPVANVARIARVLRAGRLLSSLQDLRLIVGTMLRSIPSMGHVALLLGMLFYIYGVIGYHLYGAIDPRHWGSLPRAFETLFQILTLEGWVEIQRAGDPGHPASVVYYTSFIFIAGFVVMNLFIAVVINNLETVKREDAQRHDRAVVATSVGKERTDGMGTSESEASIKDVVARLRAELEALERALQSDDRRGGIG